MRSDNGLIFQSRRFRAACRGYRLRQEFITPYTPEHNGLIERPFRTLKEECVWQHRFASFAEARREVLSWLHYYNTRRPHSALGYISPAEYLTQNPRLVQLHVESEAIAGPLEWRGGETRCRGVTCPECFPIRVDSPSSAR